MIMHSIAIDDEPLALLQIERYIDMTPFLEKTGVYPSALETIEIISEGGVDLIFADINMPDLSGIELIRSLENPPLVIFTTAYSEYAIDGFRVDALDYLLKPISYPDFLRSSEKAYRQYRLLHSDAGAPVENNSIFVKSEYQVVSVDTNDITYLESRGEYVRIHTTSDKPIMTLGSLKSFDDYLPKDRFMRIHRSYIINLTKIKTVGRKQVQVGNDQQIPIGELYETAFRDYLSQHSIR